ncbi:hypothetical protein SH2C18_19370 [Clostridium sediminicola]|uniref:hypothetical protein n=1 Tax=Clostridium sediminicola TaxID=3114879 RepID=UPI0031F2324E
MRKVFNEELIKTKEEEKKKIELKQCLTEEKGENEENLKINRKTIVDLNNRSGRLLGVIYGFQKEETKFNKEYDERLFRNLEGFLDEEELVKLDKSIKENALNLEKQRKKLGEQLQNNQYEIKSKEREKINNSLEINSTKYNLESKKENLDEFEKEIEKRIEEIKYIDFEEDKLFQSNEIIEAFLRKINFIKEDERKLRRIMDKQKEELEKLRSGRVLEIPKEIEEAFRKKDINIIYGMDWIKKNGRDSKENEEFIKNNPFIPYSIIMDAREIEILENESLEIFTSTPIPIIKREDLGKALDSTKENLLHFNNLKFFVSFNNKLLNEKELEKLMQNKKAELDKTIDRIISKEEDIEFYSKKKSFIENSLLNKENYEGLKKEIEVLKNKSEELRALEIKLEKEISNFKTSIESIQKELSSFDKEIEKNKRKGKDFERLREEYQEYKKNKASLLNLEERIKITNSQIEKDSKRNKEIGRELYDCEESIRYHKSEKERIAKDSIKFEAYKSGSIIEKDKEDLISEYNALTEKIQSSEEELQSKKEMATKRFNEVDEDLDFKVNQYALEEKEYTTVIYDRFKERETEQNIEKEENSLNKLKEVLGEIKSNLRVANADFDRFYKELKLRFDKNIAKDKSLIFEKNYSEEKAIINVKIDDKVKEKNKLDKLNLRITNNLSNLSEHSNLNIREELTIKFEFNNLDETIGKLKRDLNNLKKDESKKENLLRDIMFDIADKKEFKEDSFFIDPINTLRKLVSTPKELLEQLLMLQDCYKKLMDKIAYDIELIEKEEFNILESLLEYINEVHENIGRIDNNSSITIGNKRVKMLNISVTDWEENKEIYKIRLKDYFENLRDECILTLEKNESIEETVGNRINIFKLYDEVVSISSIIIKLYKIEEEKQRLITWNEVSTNSGGEGFLSAFVVLSSLLSYMRKDETDIFNRKEEGKVLIMDNPFAQTSSAHLLKPLIDIAKKSNTQLICLTGLSGDSIYNRFDNIYVLNLVPSKLRAGVKYLKSEHMVGEEEDIEVMVPSRFKVEEQTRLF